MDQDKTPPVYMTEEREPIGQLGPESWLTSAETAAVMDALAADGGVARFVGGCVRDGLLKRPFGVSRDVDIAATETPDRVMSLLERHRITPIPVGLSHGTVRAEVGGFSYEITTLRRDKFCDGRHAEVEFTTSFMEDARRRDFTINALSADREGYVYDYVDGMTDLSTGRVRFVGRAMDRIQEDFLRILRFFRFQAWYGRRRPNEDAVSACAALAEGVDSLSAERIRAELLRLLEAPEPSDVLSLMQGTRVLRRIFPEIGDISDLRTLVMMETRGLGEEFQQPDPFRRLAILLGAGGPKMVRYDDKTFSRFALSRAETARMRALLCPDEGRWPAPGVPDTTVLHLLREEGRNVVVDRILLRWSVERTGSSSIKANRTEAWRTLLQNAMTWTPPGFPVRGADLMARGLQGPAIGDAMNVLKRVWTDDGFRTTREELLAHWDEFAALEKINTSWKGIVAGDGSEDSGPQ